MDVKWAREDDQFIVLHNSKYFFVNTSTEKITQMSSLDKPEILLKSGYFDLSDVLVFESIGIATLQKIQQMVLKKVK